MVANGEAGAAAVAAVAAAAAPASLFFYMGYQIPFPGNRLRLLVFQALRHSNGWEDWSSRRR